MTPNTILEPASRSADATDNDDAMTEGLVANGEAVAVIDDRPGGHLDAMIVPKGAAEPRRDGAKELMRGGWSDIDWPVLGWIGGIHIAALAAPFCFTWSGLLIAVVLAWVTGGLGVCLGYHRLLTHGSFGTFRPVRWFFAFLGGISGEGSSLIWVANHRKHHVFSDQEGDPHSPRDGGFWAHMLWLFPRHPQDEVDAHIKRWAPDLQKDAGLRFLHSTFLLWHIVMGAALLASGWAYGGPALGVSWLIWGMAVRMVYVFHVTWFVNSATHMWGYRNYETTDDSTNLWWVGLLAFGEGWHNNHHAYQRMARHGHRWWEVDVTYWAILALERLGLAWDVVHTIPRSPSAAKRRAVASS
ncbi:MAG: fatty acid desaturase [Pirellulales bacterium]|jgi:fatty-acid desaturase|nr:fatty acid desaturase [Pirellulales bacterium]MBL7193104.1 fatty acid desaturase [Pirellulales bacterium]